MIFNENVNLSFSKILINDTNISIQKNKKYCIIGSNGSGKTTLLNYLYTKLKDNYNITYVLQSISINDNCSILEYMLKTDDKLYLLYDKNKKYEQMISNNIELSDNEYNDYRNISNELKIQNISKYISKIKKILNGLGFNNFDLNVSILSGGQHCKLELSKALLINPEILLLDEPTNHLDLENVLWLEKYLETYENTLIMISHNINFFDNICDYILYFFNIDPHNPTVCVSNGGYDSFVKKFNQQKEKYYSDYDKYIKNISRLKKKQDKSELEIYLTKNKMNRPIKDYEITIKFNNVNALSSTEYKNIISFENVYFGYNDDNILVNINFGISIKSRYILIGKNGEGKSTLFNICAKNLLPKSGNVYFDNRIRIGYFNQLSVSELSKLDRNMNPIQYLKQIDNNLDEQTYRSILAKVGFKKVYEGDTYDVSKVRLSELSGGQCVKLILCGIIMMNPHVLLFDEPTNHLDIYSINDFISAINNYNGGVMIITHDRYLIEKINNCELLILEKGKLEKFSKESFDVIVQQYCNM